MKKQLKLSTLLVVAAMAVACNGDFKTLDNGLQYKFETKNNSAQKVHEGDVLIGEMTVHFGDVETFSNVGKPERILRATQTFKGDLFDGLMMMHIGDHAIFAIEADTLAKFLQANQMPPYYKAGTGQKVYYDINLQGIVSNEEMEQEEKNFNAEMNRLRDQEPEEIRAYVAVNNITATPNENGLYVIVKKEGTGAKVEVNRQVSIHYTGTLLDGTMFDSSREADAKKGGIYQEGNTYEPLTYTVGQMGLIRGWEEGIAGHREGSRLQLIIPSMLAYGPRGNVGIPPYSPLVFDIEIVSVK